MAADVLGDRALNRATLARQLLLERSATAPLEAIASLVGLQAQNPLDPYLALQARLEDLDPDAVGRLLLDRSVVRIVVMRGTIHLVTAEDAVSLRPLVQPVLDAEIARHSEHAPRLAGVDLGPALAFASTLLTAEPRTGPELRAALAARFPELDPAAVAYACRCLLPLVQVPPRGVWGRSGAVRLTLLGPWVGRPAQRSPRIDDVVLRYLAAFGPATAADAAAWCRLTGMGAVLDRLAPRLQTFTDARGRVLHDLPDAPRPDPATPAPVRFLPEYDNVLLSHADRSRFGAGDPRFARVVGLHKGAVLVDGEVQAMWHAERPKGSRPSVVVTHRPLTAADAAAVEAEGARTGAFWHGEPADVRLVALDRGLS